MTLVLLVAALLRFAELPELPVGLHYDEAANLVLTREIVAGEYRPLFIRAYTGKEVLFFYAAAPWVWMTGGAHQNTGAWGLRLCAAMFGVLTVAATFAATRALLGRRSGGPAIALIAAGWMAVAFPHVLLSRYGFRAISQPLLQALTVAALWRGMRSRKIGWSVAAGALLGLTGYTYLASRLFPLPLALAGGWLLARSTPSERRRYLPRFAVVLGVAAITFAPLGIYFLRHPGTFTTRISQVAAPSLADALRGIGQCLRALFWPGAGDSYIRFNVPGLPVMDVISALLALVGVVAMLRSRRHSRLETAGRVFVLVAIAVMLLPSALATGEMTPSNLRMVGLYPFLAILPAWGLHAVLSALDRFVAGRMPGVRWRCILPVALSVGLLIAGAGRTATTYVRWAGSDALFRVTDGEMVLAAEALDATIDAAQDSAEQDAVTVYIASEHYRHPTVAALAENYAQAKWLSGGASLVLPPQGDAVYLIPESLAPPAAWPEAVTAAWTTHVYSGPAGTPALWAHRLPAADVAEARDVVLGATAADPADFAHVVLAHDARPATFCRAGESCPVLVLWEPLAPYPTLQPVVRWVHPETGEWVRTMAFHYPPEMWTAGDLVLDYLVLDVPAGTPPVDGYQLGVRFYDPSLDEALPRLQDELFAGLEARFPDAVAGFDLSPATTPLADESAEAACAGIPRDRSAALGALNLLGWTGAPVESLLPGSALLVALCWQAEAAAPAFDGVSLYLTGPAETTLYAGDPASGYGFALWREGEVIEDRYPLRLPRDLPAGDYTLWVALNDASGVRTGSDRVLWPFTVAPLARNFAVPEMASEADIDFVGAAGEGVRLLGYDLEPLVPGQPWRVTLAWQAIGEMADDYIVFLHLRGAEGDALVAQVDAMPLQGSYPTSLWLDGEVVIDSYELTPPADLAPGDYTLYVGFYLQTGGRLLTEGAYRAHLAELQVTQ